MRAVQRSWKSDGRSSGVPEAGLSDNILMPKLGLTMTEGLLSSWLVQAGSEVNKGDVICVVETEKIANEIEAERAGTIGALLVKEGDTVPVGTAMAVWSDGNAKAALDLPTAENEPSKPAEPTPIATTPLSVERIVATPLARRLARQAGLDLGSIVGSGPRGKIKAADVKPGPAEPAAPPVTMTANSGNVPPAPQRTGVSLSMRKIIARRLTQSKQTIPHFYVLASADVTELLDLRLKLNAMETRQRASINHFILAAAGRSLQEMPEFAVLWQDESLVTVATSDVGIAVDAPSGLVVPLLRDAGTMPFGQLVGESLTLVDKARNGGLKPGDLEGGVISVSNIGMFGSTHLVPIINPGQTAILGIGSAKAVFRPDRNGQPSARQEINLTLSADHRAIDGVLAARFLNRVVAFLESPLRLVTNF